MKITDIAKNMACMLLLAYAATVAAQENTASFLYRLNGDFNDGTFSSGNQTTIQYWKKNSESSSIYTMVSEGKKILKFAIAGTLETSLFLPAGNYTLRMNVPAFRRSGSLGTVGGEDMGFWVRVKRGSEYLDSDMSDGMSDGLFVPKSAVNTGEIVRSVTVRIPGSGEYTIEMKASSSCNIDIDWIELTAGELEYSNNYNVYNSCFKTIPVNPYFFYDLKGWEVRDGNAWSGTPTNTFCGELSNPIQFDSSNLLFSDHKLTAIVQKLTKVPAGDYLLKFDCAGMADEADVKLSSVTSGLVDHSFFESMSLKQQSFSYNVTLPSEANLELVFSILPAEGMDVRLSNIELVKVNTGIYNADFSNPYLGWHFEENVARENSASSAEKGYYMTLYPYDGEHNEVKASQYVTGIAPGAYQLECLLATESGASGQDVFRVKIETGNPDNDRELSVNLGDLSAYPVEYTNGAYRWYKVSTLPFPVMAVSDLVKISFFSNSGMKVMVDDVALKYSGGVSVNETTRNAFTYLINGNYLIVDKLEDGSTVRLYTTDGILLYESGRNAAGGIRIELPGGQRMFLLEVRSANQAPVTVKLLRE